jgi:ATP-dependent RNA helicase SUPV3L1/SUV3
MNLQIMPDIQSVPSGRDVTAILGPTNTGKTHLAIERMVAHESGVIGLPLRLLAREVYGRVVEKVGAPNVALHTGEEKITPPGARFSICTVEAMPRETDAAFVAIDEVQLAGDLERGHIFTDRILNLRGRQETLLLGAATMRGIIERLLKGVSTVTRPRMSHLAYAGQKKITRLPRRSAIVAFSADEVYAIGELIRRQRGGVAVVMGALSPRTRNAQVALYQSGDVDYLVATDAIGMGLNLDVDHVAFAQNSKFDGFQFRDLTAAELGQIAGRAGRHLRDGTFGVTGQVDPFADDLVEKVEGHDFEPVKVLQWRTASFDFSSLDALKRSIETTPAFDGLTKALPAVDQRALENLSKEPDIRDLATSAERVAMLWDACALPDYRRIAPAQHADLIASIYLDLVRKGQVDEDYLANQVERSASTEGDIDTLSARIAQIRTWTFVSNRPGWLADPTHWQEKTREIEDRLSDALHERLTKRFVDRRTSVLMKRLRENSMPEAEIGSSGTVMVEGHHVGELQGFRFTADQSAEGEDAKAVRAAAQKALAQEFEERAERFSACPNGDLALASDGTLRWIGAPVATLTSGDDALKPRVILLADEQLTGSARDHVAARAERFVSYQIESLLKPLLDLTNAEQLSGMARGIAFRLVENFGLLNRRDVAADVKALDQEARAALRRLGVRFGAYHIFVPALVKPGPAGLLTLLWALKNDARDRPGFGDVVQLLAAGRTSVVTDPAFDPAFYRLAGFRVLGRRAVRVDILERLADLIRPALAWKAGTGARPDGAFDGNAFTVTPAMMSILGAKAEDMEEILKGLGYRAEAKPAAEVTARLEALDRAAREAAEAAAAAKAAAEIKAAEAAREEAQATAVEADGQVSAEAGQPEALQADGAAEPAVAEGQVVAAEPQPEPQQHGEATAFEPAVEAEPAASAVSESRQEAEPATSHDSEPAQGEAATEHVGAATSLSVTEAAEQSDAGDTSQPAPAVEQAESDIAPSLEGQTPVEPALPEANAEAEAEAPKPVLLWRPARFERPRHQHHRGHGKGHQGGGAEAGGEERNGGHRRFARKGKPGRFDGEGNNRQDRNGPRKGGHDGPRKGKPAFQKPREERPVRFDPDSPFAKLAALRDQLKK